MSEYDSTLPRRQLGRYLREYRLALNLTLEEAARLMEWSKSPLQRLEKGQTERIRSADVRELCRLYGVPDHTTDGLCQLARQTAHKSWYHDFGDVLPENLNLYLGLESAARELTSYQEIVPGLLQTSDYALVLTRESFPDSPADEHARHVQLRMKRQTLINRRSRPMKLDVVIHESAVRRLVGEPKVMAAQMRSLADVSTRPNVELRVLPFTAGYPEGILTGPFVIMNFGDNGKGTVAEPPVVYIESMINGNLYLEKNEDIERYRRAYDAIRTAALDPVSSRSLLRQAAKEYKQ